MKPFFLLLILASVFLTGCEEKEPIRIGFSGCLTGMKSSLAISGRNAAILAVAELNHAGGINGRQVELVTKDDAENPETAAAVEREFINEGIPVVIGHYISGVICQVKSNVSLKMRCVTGVIAIPRVYGGKTSNAEARTALEILRYNYSSVEYFNIFSRFRSSYS